MLIVHTDRHIKKMPMAADYTHEREHESAKGNTQQEDERLGRASRHPGILDPHFWTSPPLAMLMARNILTGLLEVDPLHGAAYMGGYKNCIRELLELDADLMGMFAGKKDVEFIVFHPSWGYFAGAYGLKQIPVEIEGKQPKPAQLQHLIQYARERGIRVIFVQPQLSTKSAETIAQAIGGEVVFADPLAEDWAQNLHDQAAKFEAALK
jgi:zinc transport system substrate-binding protein